MTDRPGPKAGRIHRVRRRVGWVLAGVALLAITFAATLAMPVETWRTGERYRAVLPVLPVTALPPPAERIWIDADAGCGAGARVDPDDCLAILHLALRDDVEIVGLSSVFGNASLDVTDHTARELAARLERKGRALPEIRRGAAGPLGADSANRTDASAALIAALAEQSLTIVALGPLTNIAAALSARPDLQDNVERIVAVMGRRPGHLFHPAEGSGEGMLFGHGPVFRDFNVAQDARAVGAILAMDVPLALVPYEAAREVEIDAAALDRMAAAGPASHWVARHSRPWLEYWNSDIGRDGFYPFDLLAAVFVTEPDHFACADVTLELRRDSTINFPFSRLPSLLVEPVEYRAASGIPSTLYCHGLNHGADRAITRTGHHRQ